MQTSVVKAAIFLLLSSAKLRDLTKAASVLHVEPEPFSLQIRHLPAKGDVKLIWWFIAVVGKDRAPNKDRSGEENLTWNFTVTKKL